MPKRLPAWLVMTPTFVLSTFFLSTAPSVMSQVQISLERPKLTSIAPEAASVQKYVDYPVNYSVGIPDVSIPLYEIRMGDLTLPISLSYHSSGMKPKEHGGRIAKGWTMNAEPSFSRNIQGMADDAILPYLESGYFEQNNRPAIPIADPLAQSKEMVRRYIDKEWDAESDDYYYNLNPGGGKAYVNYNPGGGAIQLVTYPRTNDIVLCNRVYTISNFEVTTAQGVKYQFGNGANSKERWGDDVTRWMCNRISSAKTNAEITFSYAPAPGNMLNPAVTWDMNHTLIIEDSLFYPNNYGPSVKTMLTEQKDGVNTNWHLISPTQKQIEYNASGSYLGANTYNHPQTIEVSELRTIYFGPNRVEFSYNNEGLNLVTVLNANGETIRTIELFTAKYNVSTPHSKLDSIRITAPGCESKLYKFKYYGEALVPGMYTRNIDHWGYCNGPGGIANTPLAVPTIKTMTFFHGFMSANNLYYEIPGANREPNHEYTKAGILAEVTNPDGVVTNFEYAGNAGAFLMYYRGSSEYAYNKYYRHPVGGVRVQRITTTEPLTGKIHWRLFEYGFKLPTTSPGEEPIWGGGAIKHIVTDRDYCLERQQQVEEHYGYPIRTSRIRSWGSMPISQITFNNGSAVMYSIVRESQYGPDEPQVLKTQYHYSVTPHIFYDIFQWDNYYAANPQLLPLDYVNNAYQRVATRSDTKAPYDMSDTDMGAYADVFDGQLEKKEIFRNDTLIASTEYLYEKKFNDLNGTRAVIVNRPFRSNPFFPAPDNLQGPQAKKQNDVFTSGYNSMPQSKWNRATTYWKALVKETSNEYDYSSGQTKVLTNVKDFAFPYYNVNPYIITTQSSSQQTIVDSVDYNPDYKDVLSFHKRAKGGLFSESRIDFVSGTRPSVVKHRTSLMPAYQDQVSYNAYDHFGNVAEVTSKDGVHSVYIWGYKNQYLLAEIVNLTYAQLLANSNTGQPYIADLGNKANPDQSDLNLLNSLRTAFPQSLVTTYTYKPLVGLTSVSDPNGQTIYFVHDAFGRLTEKYRIENGVKKILELVEYSFAR